MFFSHFVPVLNRFAEYDTVLFLTMCSALRQQHTGAMSVVSQCAYVVAAFSATTELSEEVTSTTVDSWTEVEDIMRVVTALRKKHHPQVDCQSNHISTVGLVVEGGCHISAVVPGGPCDREFGGERIEAGDTIKRVDGKNGDLLSLLVGDDLVGSHVCLTIQKHDAGGQMFDCKVERQALARIHAVGQMFLILTELIADIEEDKKIATVLDLLRVEAQAKRVNDVTNVFLSCFKSHVHDLEAALFEFFERVNSQMEKRTSHLRKIATDSSAEARYLSSRVQDLEVQLRGALQHNSRRERTDKALQNEVEMLKIELEGSQGVNRELEAQLKELKNRAGAANREMLQVKNQLAAAEGQSSVAKKNCLDLEAQLGDFRQLTDRGDEKQLLLGQELAQLKQRYAQLEGERDMLTAHFEALTKVSLAVESERDALKADLSMLKAQLGEVTSCCDEKLKEMAKLKQMYAQLEGERDMLKAEVNMFKAQLGEVTSSCENKLKEMLKELEKMRAKLALISMELENERKTTATVEGVCEALKAELIALKAKLDEAASSSGSSLQEVEHLRAQLSTSSQQLEQERQALITFKVNCKCEALNAELNALKVKLKEVSSKLNEVSSGSESTVQQLRDEVQRLRAQLATVSQELQDLKAKCTCDSLKSQLEECVQERNGLREEIERLRAEMAKCTCDSLKSQLEECAKERNSLREEIQILRAEITRLETLVAELRAQCDMCECEKLKTQLADALEHVDVLEKRLKPRLQLV